MAGGVCKLCLKEVDKFVKSHIIPKAFFDKFGKGERLVQMHESDKTKNAHYSIGIYGHFLCLDCEKKFQTFDDNAINVILKTTHNVVIEKDKYSKANLIKNAIQHKENLNKFALSVLWRASVSGLEAYKNIQLGRYQKDIAQAITCNQFSNELLNKTGLLYRKIKDESGLDAAGEPYKNIGKGCKFKKEVGNFHAHMFGFPYGRFIIKLGGDDVKIPLVPWDESNVSAFWTSQLDDDVTDWIYLSSPVIENEILTYGEIYQNHQNSIKKK